MAECPTCNESFKSKRGVKVHHKKEHGESIAGFEKECDNCENKFRDNIKDNGLDNNFCSPECYYEWRSKNLVGNNNPNWSGNYKTYVCDYCGGDFKRNKNNIEDHKFCGEECFSKYLVDNNIYSKDNHPHWSGDRIKKECKFCGESYKVAPGLAEITSFCKQECQANWESKNRTGENHPLWEGGYDSYNKGNWTTVRKKVRKSRPNKCKKCGMKEEQHYDKYDRDLDVHHIKPLKTFDDPNKANNTTNLVVVCKSCHQELEQLSILEQERELGLMEWREAV